MISKGRFVIKNVFSWFLDFQENFVQLLWNFLQVVFLFGLFFKISFFAYVVCGMVRKGENWISIRKFQFRFQFCYFVFLYGFGQFFWFLGFSFFFCKQGQGVDCKGFQGYFSFGFLIFRSFEFCVSVLLGIYCVR